MKTKLLFIIMLCGFGHFGFGQATDLIISEYGEGSSGNAKYIEIYNGTGTTVNLANYKLWKNLNGDTWPASTYTFTNSTLADDATLVIANNATDTSGAHEYDGFCNWNGDDAVGLAKSGVLIDVVGTDGGDPGTGWNVAGTTNATKDHTLTRKPTICSPNTNWATSAGTNTTDSEWVVTTYVNGPAIAGHTATCSPSCTPPGNPTGTISGITPACNSTSLSFSGSATDPVVNYWQTSATGVATTNNASSAYPATVSGTYHVRAYNTSTLCWSAGTVSYAVVINSPPTIDTQPTDQTVSEGNDATFSVVSSDATSYVWEEFDGTSWSTIGTSATLTLIGVPIVKDGYQYRVTISNGNGCGTTVSNTVTLTISTGACLDYGFSGGTTAPSGWTFTGISGTYTSTGNYGVSSPSIRFDHTNDRVQTPTVANAVELSFWLNGQGTNAVSALLVEGYDGSAWTPVHSINPLPTTGTNYTYNATSTPALPNNFQRFRFTYTKGAGNLAFDDVRVYCGVPITGREINVTGNSSPIPDGSTAPAPGNNTDFGSILINNDLTKTFSIHNIGDADLSLNLPITLSNIAAPQEFTVTQPVLSVIPAGGSTTFTVTFNSAVVGLFISTVQINNNDASENPYTFDIIATATGSPPTGTIYNPGELIFVGYDGQFFGSGSDDGYLIATMVDMVQGTKFSVVNSRYEAGAAANIRTNKWGGSGDYAFERPGVATITYNGTAVIPAGSVLHFITNGSNSWFGSVQKIVGTTTSTVTSSFSGVLLNTLNQANISTSGSDQMYLMQGSFVADATPTTPNEANYFLNGTLLHGLTNRAAWVPLSNPCNGGSTGGNTRESRLPAALTCFNVENVSSNAVSGFYENDKEHGIATLRNIILSVADVANTWTLGTGRYNLLPASNATTDAGKTFLIGASNDPGQWVGTINTNWFNCANWEGLKVPDQTTNVSVNAAAINDAAVNALAPYSDDYSDLATCNDLTINGKKVVIEGSINNKLEVNGNLLIDTTLGGILDMDDSNPVAADGELYLHGNWTNIIGTVGFEEGNGTVIFDGTGTQVVTYGPPLPPNNTEEFFSVVLNNDWDTSVSNNLFMNGNLTINSGKTLTVPSDNYVHVDNNLTINGTFNILNNGSLIQVKESSVNTGKISMERKASIKNHDYVYWSSPINGFLVGNITATTYIYKWNPTGTNANGTQGNWISAVGEAMEQGKGYIVRAPNGQPDPITPGALNFTATFYNGNAGEGIPNNGEIPVQISRGSNTISVNDQDDNWNLIGNPYPSAISAIDFLTYSANAPLLDGFVNIWKHGLAPDNATDPFYQDFVLNYHQSDYFYYNSSGSSDGPASFDGYIAAGQSFMVNMVDGALPESGTIYFKNSMRDRSHENNDFFRSSSEEKHRVWLDLISPSNFNNRILVGYVQGATMEKDRMYDAIITHDGIEGFYSVMQEESYIIQGRALPFVDTDRIPLGIKAIEEGSYTISIYAVDGLFETDNQTIFLKDNLLNLIHNLTNQPYSFNLEIGTFNDRFEIVFTDQALSVTDHDIPSSDVSIIELHNGQVKFSVGHNLTIKSVQIFDMLGRSLYNLRGSHGTELYNLNGLSQAAYIAKVTLSNGQTITKQAVKRH